MSSPFVFSFKLDLPFIGAPKEVPAADPWGGSTNTNSGGNDWAQFDTAAEWPQTKSVSDVIQYRVLYDYASERPDELSITSGDIITVSHGLVFVVQMGLLTIVLDRSK